MTATVEIQITQNLKRHIDCNNYHCIDGGKEENILCALLVVLGTPGVRMSLKNFLRVYIWFVQTLYAGINIDFSIHPILRNTALSRDAKLMKSRKEPNLLEADTIRKVARFICGDDGRFEKALNAEISEWEVKLLLSAFSPGSIVG